MYIYWREWTRPPLTKEEAKKLADEFRTWFHRIQDERREMERIAKRIDKTLN